jgi:hypothetical protein
VELPLDIEAGVNITGYDGTMVWDWSVLGTGAAQTINEQGRISGGAKPVLK